MAGNLVVRITPSDVGRRVSVRARIPAEPGGPSTTDTVGRLVAWTEGRLSIQRRDGSVAQVEEARLLAGKVLPDTPPRRQPG